MEATENGGSCCTFGCGESRELSESIINKLFFTYTLL